ncbi:MAG: SH3 domain-containing protein [Acholeplasmatales bacterium]|nr:SH3 domain-containing protein [Acholeplasmatales bacterium]
MKRKLSLVMLMMLVISLSSVALSHTSDVTRRSIKDSVLSSREDTTALSEDDDENQLNPLPNVNNITEFFVSSISDEITNSTDIILDMAKEDLDQDNINEMGEEKAITVTKVDEIYYSAADSLNVRENPDIKSDIITTLNTNDEVHVIGELEDEDYEDWVQIEIDGDPAYVAARYLSKEQLEQEYAKGTWNGTALDANLGRVYGPNGYETYYNLNMKNIVNELSSMGVDGNYWVREDGVKMYGDYVMIAADLNKYPKGTLLETSVGIGIVCDTGEFVTNGSGVEIDVAVEW